MRLNLNRTMKLQRLATVKKESLRTSAARYKAELDFLFTDREEDEYYGECDCPACTVRLAAEGGDLETLNAMLQAGLETVEFLKSKIAEQLDDQELAPVKTRASINKNYH